MQIEASTVEIEERGVKLRLTVVDTPGYGDAINSQDWWVWVRAGGCLGGCVWLVRATHRSLSQRNRGVFSYFFLFPVLSPPPLVCPPVLPSSFTPSLKFPLTSLPHPLFPTSPPQSFIHPFTISLASSPLSVCVQGFFWIKKALRWWA